MRARATFGLLLCGSAACAPVDRPPLILPEAQSLLIGSEDRDRSLSWRAVSLSADAPFELRREEAPLAVYVLSFPQSLAELGLSEGAIDDDASASADAIVPRDAARAFVFRGAWEETAATALPPSVAAARFPSMRSRPCDYRTAVQMAPANGFLDYFGSSRDRLTAWGDLVLLEAVNLDGAIVFRSGLGFPGVIGLWVGPDGTNYALTSDGRLALASFSDRTLESPPLARIPDWIRPFPRLDPAPTLVVSSTSTFYLALWNKVLRIDRGAVTVLLSGPEAREARVEAVGPDVLITGLGPSLTRILPDGQLTTERLPWQAEGIIRSAARLSDGSEVAVGYAESAFDTTMELFKRPQGAAAWEPLAHDGLLVNERIGSVFGIGTRVMLSIAELSVLPFSLYEVRGPEARASSCAQHTRPSLVRSLDPYHAFMLEMERFPDGTTQTLTLSLLYDAP